MFLTFFNLYKKRRVEMVSEAHAFWEEIIPMNVVIEFPPMLSFNTLVRIDSR
jgi:hypothetical protein